jgi:hypothetical protein
VVPAQQRQAGDANPHGAGLAARDILPAAVTAAH